MQSNQAVIRNTGIFELFTAIVVLAQLSHPLYADAPPNVTNATPTPADTKVDDWWVASPPTFVQPVEMYAHHSKSEPHRLTLAPRLEIKIDTTILNAVWPFWSDNLTSTLGTCSASVRHEIWPEWYPSPTSGADKGHSGPGDSAGAGQSPSYYFTNPGTCYIAIDEIDDKSSATAALDPYDPSLDIGKRIEGFTISHNELDIYIGLYDLTPSQQSAIHRLNFRVGLWCNTGPQQDLTNEQRGKPGYYLVWLSKPASRDDRLVAETNAHETTPVANTPFRALAANNQNNDSQAPTVVAASPYNPAVAFATPSYKGLTLVSAQYGKRTLLGAKAPQENGLWFKTEYTPSTWSRKDPNIYNSLTLNLYPSTLQTDVSAGADLTYGVQLPPSPDHYATGFAQVAGGLNEAVTNVYTKVFFGAFDGFNPIKPKSRSMSSIQSETAPASLSDIAGQGSLEVGPFWFHSFQQDPQVLGTNVLGKSPHHENDVIALKGALTTPNLVQTVGAFLPKTLQARFKGLNIAVTATGYYLPSYFYTGGFAGLEHQNLVGSLGVSAGIPVLGKSLGVAYAYGNDDSGYFKKNDGTISLNVIQSF